MNRHGKAWKGLESQGVPLPPAGAGTPCHSLQRVEVSVLWYRYLVASLSSPERANLASPRVGSPAFHLEDM